MQFWIPWFDLKNCTVKPSDCPYVATLSSRYTHSKAALSDRPGSHCDYLRSDLPFHQPYFLNIMRFVINQRFQCPATMFDGDGPDSTGKLFSETHAAAGHGQFAKGTVKRALNREPCYALFL